MAEEQTIMEPTTFAEINAAHSFGDMGMPPLADDGQKTDPPAGDPPAGEPPAGEPVNWENRYKEFETSSTKKETDYLAKIKEHEGKIEELNKKPPPVTHKDSDLSRLEVVKESKPEKFPFYTRLLFGNPDSKELWKMDFVEKNPKYADNPEMVNMMLEAEYQAYFDEDADVDSKEYKIAAAKLEIAGEQIKAQKLAEFKAIAVSDPQEVEKVQQQQKTELAKSWEIPFSELAKSPLKVAQKIVLDDKSDINVDFGLQAEDNKRFTEAMGLFILHNNLAPTAENAEKAKNYAVGEILREKFPEILKATFQKEFEKRHAEWQKSRNNNRPLAPTSVSGDGKKSTDQSIMDLLEHGEAYVPNS